MSEYTSDAEWRSLILGEVRDLRKEFQEFKFSVVKEESEKRGAGKLITAALSFVISLAVVLLDHVWNKR